MSRLGPGDKGKESRILGLYFFFCKFCILGFVRLEDKGMRVSYLGMQSLLFWVSSVAKLVETQGLEFRREKKLGLELNKINIVY